MVATTARLIRKLKVADIRPNRFNPNRMPDAQFREYVNEADRLGRLSKPVIVRRVGDTYEIVDGEHGWRAAKELDWEEVDCEIVEADDFEARVQCYKRNRGGKDHPVLLGRMFREMVKARGSARALAKEIDVAEASIRQCLSYARAADVRTKCAGEDRTDEIAELSRRQLRTYLLLPDEMRERWLDAGADLSVFRSFVRGTLESDIVTPLKVAELSFVFSTSREPFFQTLCYAMGLAKWRDNCGVITNRNAYVRPVAELSLPVEVLDALPRIREGHRVNVAISSEAWTTLLQRAAKRASNSSGLIPLVQTGVRVALRDAGVDPADVLDLGDIERLQIVSGAAEYIRSAEFLSLVEQAWLQTVQSDAPNDVLDAAKRATCELLREQRTSREAKTGEPVPTSIDVILHQFIRQLMRQHTGAQERELLSDQSHWRKRIFDHVSALVNLRDNQIGGRAADMVIRDRLSRIDWPELILIGAPLFGIPADRAAEHWLNALSDGKTERERQE